MLKSPGQAALLQTPPITYEANIDSAPIVLEKATMESIALGDPGPSAQALEDFGLLPKPVVDPIISGNSQPNSRPNPILPLYAIGFHTPSPHTSGLNPGIDILTHDPIPDILKNDPFSDNPILALPSDVAQVILEKIPASILDCSNPLSSFENCTLADPTSSTSQSKNLLELHSTSEDSISGHSKSPIAAPSVNLLPMACYNP